MRVAECDPKMSSNFHVFSTTRFAFSRQTENVYKNVNRKIEKGVACPTCISVNNVVCHFSPLDNDESVLKAHTHVLQEGPITGRAEDVIAAANTAAEVALRLVRPGKKDKDWKANNGAAKNGNKVR